MIKKLVYILITIIIFSSSTLANTQSGRISNETFPYQFRTEEEKKCLSKAETYMKLWERAKKPQDKAYYLQNAMRNYFMVTQADKTSINAHIGLGRVYDEMHMDDYAKKHFFIAYNMDYQNPELNYYFADYYRKRNNLTTAIKYYKSSYNNGLSSNYNLNYNMALVYEKLADIENAIKYYSKAYKLNPHAVELAKKIHLLDDLNYSKSQYYLYKK